MHKLVTLTLRRPAVQAICAWALDEVPGATRLLRFAHVPAQEAFIAFVQAMRSAGPYAPTRCVGWTVHELTAHIAAGSAEIADLIELELAGAPARATRDFEEREAPFRAYPPQHLRRAFFRQALRATVAIELLSKAQGSRGVRFTGALLDARMLVLHSESELVLHRWDIVGNDEISIRALSDPRFGLHAAMTVASMEPNVFPPRGGEDETVILRCPGAPDIAVTGGSITTIEPGADKRRDPVVQCDPAARTLLLWGRCPQPGLPDLIGDPAVVAAVVAMLRPDPTRGYGAA